MSDTNPSSAQPEPEQSPPTDSTTPRFVVGRGGTRLISINALIERVVDTFNLEHGDSSTALRDADTPARRLRLILDTASYVFAVESVHLSDAEKAHIVERAYSDLFGYGPLDPFFLDPRVTTISIKGARSLAVRYGHGELVNLGQIFDDEEHLQRMITRLLLDAETDYPNEISGDMGSVEVGLVVGERPVSIHLFTPPLTTEINADLRIHPRIAPTLSDLTRAGCMTEDAAELIAQIANSGYGFVIVGEPETGKTTLLNAIAQILPQPERMIAVERARELRLPQGAVCRAACSRSGEREAVTFADQIRAALEENPATLLLDEVRGDDPRCIAPLLDQENTPRQIWVVRGVPDAKRLQSAMGMLARRAAYGAGERLVHALYERLPFIITVARIREQLQLFSIAEWQSRVDTDYPDYVMLMRYQDGAARRTDAALARWLN
jgi:pilus assembly protein CpaF